MAFFEDFVKRFGDVFDFSDNEEKKAKAKEYYRPEAEGGPLGAATTVNPAYTPKENEFDKPLWIAGASQNPFGSWATDYMDRMFKQQDSLAEKKLLGKQFSQDDATGVVTWDHVNDKNQELRWGDVFDKGEFKGNIYDELDENEANLLMSQLTLEKTVISQIGRDKDPMKRLSAEINRVRTDNNERIPAALRQMEFQEAVDKRQERFGFADDAFAILSSAASGAVFTAKVSKDPRAIALGALAWGAGTALNMDDISEQAAAGIEITKRVFEDDAASGIGEGASQAAGVLGRLALNPISNIVRGSADAMYGNLNDGVGAFQNENTPGIVRGLDMVAAIGDAAISFGSSTARRVFMTQMAMHGVASVEQLTLGRGNVWDSRSAEVDNVYSNGFKEALSAWGAASIDFIQLGMARGLANKINPSASGISALDRKTVAGLKGYADDAVGVEIQAGRKFFIEKDSGKVLGARLTSTTLAPSEGLQAAVASQQARKISAKRMENYTPEDQALDDLYKASVNFAMGQNPMKTALTNAFGEGTEEAVQEVLHAVSTEHMASFDEVATAWAYGAAMGLGMSVATNMQSAKGIEAQAPLIAQGFKRITGQDITADDIAKMDYAEKRFYLQQAFDPQEAKAMKAVVESIQDMMGSRGRNKEYQSHVLQKMEQDILDQALKNTGGGTNDSLRLMGNNLVTNKFRDSDDGSVMIDNGVNFADDAAPTSEKQLLKFYKDRINAYENDVQTLQRVIDQLDATIAERQAQGASTVDVEERRAKKQRTLDSRIAQQPIIEEIVKVLEPGVAKIAEARKDDDVPRLMELVTELNKFLDSQYRSQDENRMMAAGVTGIRLPHDNIMSYAINAPGIEWFAAKTGQDNAWFIPIPDTDVRTADFDGDRSSAETVFLIDPETYIAIATGVANVTFDEDGNVTTKIKSTTPDVTFARMIADMLGNNAMTPGGTINASMVVQSFEDFTRKLKNRYNLSSTDAFSKDIVDIFINNRSTDPIEDLMRLVNKHFREEIATRAKGKVNNKWVGRGNEFTFITQLFRAHSNDLMNEYNSVIAANTRIDKKNDPKTDRADLLETDYEARRVKEVVSSTPLLTALGYTGTADLLRLIQMAYTGIKSAKDPLGTEADRGTVAGMIEDKLWLMAQMTNQAASDLSISATNVAGRVKAMAEMVVESDPAFKGMDKKQAAFALLRTPVNNIDPETNKVIPGVEPITMGQIFTARIVADIKSTYGAVIQRDKELVSKLDLLEKAALNNDWGRTVIMRDALGYFAIGDLLDASAFTEELGWPPAASLENRVRYLQTLNRTERAEVRRKLASLEAFAEGTPGRAVLDELFEMANAVIAINDDGTLTGQLAASNESGSKAFKDVWTYVRTAMSNSNVTTPNELHNLINQEMVSWQIIEAVIKDIGLMAFGMDRNNKPVLRDWVADVFLEKDFDKAEMLLWNARVETVILDARAQLDYKETLSRKPDEAPLKIKTNDTLAQAFIDALNVGDGSYQDMRIKFASFSSRAEAEKYFNTLGLKTPIMMYENNKKVFDPSLAKGGWVTETGSAFKKAMQEAVSPAQTFSENIIEIKNRDEANQKAVAQLNSLRDSKKDLATIPEWNNYKKLVFKAVKDAGTMPGTLTIRTMISALAKMFSPQPGGAQKGNSPKNLLPYATSELVKAVQAAFVDSTREFLAQQNGKFNIDIVRANTSLIFRPGTIVVDNDGTEIDLSVLRNSSGDITPESLLDAMNEHPKLRPLIIDALLPKVYAYNELTETIRPAFTAFTNLDDAINHSNIKAFEQSVAGSGQFTLAGNEEFTRLVSSEAQKLFPSEVGVVERNVLSIAISRIGSASNTLTETEIKKIVIESLNDFASAMREGASVLAYDGEDSYQRTIELAKDEQKKRFVEHKKKLHSEIGSLLLQQEKDAKDLATDTLMKVFKAKAKIKGYEDAEKIASKLRKIASLDPASKEYKEVIKEASQFLVDQGGNDRTLRWIEKYFGKNEYIDDLWMRFWPESMNDSAQLDMLQLYLREHKFELLNAVKGKSPALERFNLNLHVELEEWQEIATWVMGHIMQRLSAPVVSTDDLITPVTEETKHLFDASYSMRLNAFNKDDSIGTVLSEVAQEYKPELSRPNGTDRFFKSLLKLWSPKTSTLWTTEIANAQEAFDAPFNSASAKTGITLGGSIPRTWHALTRASYRNTTPIDASRATQITVALNGDTVEVFDPVTGKFSSGPDKYLLQGAFVTGAVDATNNAVSIGGLTLSTPREPLGTQFVMTNLNDIKLALQSAQGHLTISYLNPFRGRNEDSTEFNSLYFDGGMPFMTIAPYYDSLIAELVYGPGGLNQISQQQPLHAIKKKLNAINKVMVNSARLPNLNNPQEVEAYFLYRAQDLVDFNIMGDSKKKAVKLGSSKFRAVLKLVAMTHVVKTASNEIIPVDAYFARVYSNDQATVDSVKNATLVPLSVEQTNTLYGEAGGFGLARQGEPMVSRTSGEAFSWDFLDAQQQNVLKNLKKGPIPLEDSKLVNVPFRKRASELEVRLDDPDSRIYKRLTVLKETRKRLETNRTQYGTTGKVNWADTRSRFQKDSIKVAERDLVSEPMLRALQASEPANDVNPGRGADNNVMGEKSIGIVLDFAADKDTKPNIFNGQVSSLEDIKTLENEIGGIGYGDGILIDVDQFKDPATHDKLFEIVNHVADKQLSIRVFGKGPSGSHLRRDIANMLIQRYDYGKQENRPGIFQPLASVSAYAALRAYESRAFEQGAVSSVSRVLRLSLDRSSVEGYNLIENQSYLVSELGTFAWHNTVEKLQSSVVYNAVTVQNQDRLISELRKLFEPNNQESVKILKKLKKAYGKGFDKAIEDLKERVKRNHIPKMVGDELFEGMIIPMIVESPYDGGVPSYYFKVLGSESTPDGRSEMGDFINRNRDKQWFIDKRTKNKNQSLFPGTITGIFINERGDTVYQTSVALQEYANKLQQGADEGAMKWLTKLLPERLQAILGMKLFNTGANNQPFGDLHIVSYGPDDASKLAEEKSILNTRELFATFGTDQTPLWYEGFYGEKYVSTKENKIKMTRLLELLQTIGESENFLSNDEIHNRIQDMASKRIIENMLLGSSALSLEPFAEVFLKEFKNSAATVRELPAAKLALASALIYLCGEQNTLNDIRSASGFIQEGSYSSNFASRYMSNAYTQIFDLHTGKDSLRSWAVNEVNSILNVNNETDGWQLLDDYRVQRVFVDENGKVATISGVLSHGVVVARGEQASSPDKYGEVQRDFSLTNQVIAEGSVGGDFSSTFEDPQFAAYVKGMIAFKGEDITGFEGFTQGMDNGKFNADAFRGRKSRNKFLRLGIAEMMFKGRARDDLTAFFERIDFSVGETAKDKELQKTNEDLKRDLANELFQNGEDQGHYIDYMIRLMMGRPGGKEPGAILNQQEIALALNAIKDNIRHGFSPMYRGMVAWVPAEIRRALAPKLLKGNSTWTLMYYNTDTNQLEPADTLEKIDFALYDHAFNDKEAKFDPAFALTISAIYHQYLSAANDTLNMPVSLDFIQNLQILASNSIIEKEINNLFIAALKKAKEKKWTAAEFAKEHPEFINASLSSAWQIELTPQAAHNLPKSANLAMILGSSPELKELFERPLQPQEQLREYAQGRMSGWRKKVGAAFPVAQTLRGNQTLGTQVQDSLPDHTPIIRSMLGISAALRLNSPPLAVAGAIEGRMRNNIFQLRKLLTGESTGMLGMWWIKLLESDRKPGVLLRGAGAMTIYTEQDAILKRRIASSSATVSQLREIIHEELDYLNGKMYEKTPKIIYLGQKWGNALQDLARGTRSKTATNAYLDAALASIAAQGGSIQQVLARLSQDGAYIAKQKKLGNVDFTQAHAAGIMAINDLRATQQTALNMVLDFPKRKIKESGNVAVNSAGALLYTMPLMFTRYAANFALTALGLRGFDQLAAVALDGRKRGTTMWGSIHKAVTQKQDTDFVPRYDMSEVTDGLDIMNSFVDMGLTHARLFLAGLLAGSLGLSGEDEETKRRRRLAEAQGAGFLYDPRQIENDFRNAEAIFLNWLPDTFAEYFRVTPATYDENGNKISDGAAMANLHWTVKPFFSPIIGMEKFFNTGDIRQIWWGFHDAFTSMPIVNSITLNKAHSAAAELSIAAEEASMGGDVNGLTDTASFLAMMVGNYQYLLMESSFVNSLYMAFDEYDRDPYVLPLRDSDRDLQGDIEGNVRPNDVALEPFINDEGQIQQGYRKPSQSDVTLASMTENRASLAIIASLFSGFTSDSKYWRYNMAVKTRTVDKPEMDIDKAKAAVLGGFVSNEEVLKLLNGETSDTAMNDASASRAVALSFLNEEGNEVLTNEGAMAIYRGIVGGTMPLGSENMGGIYIPMEMRKQIQVEWLEELTNEGVDLGLSESAAKSRAKKVWYGSDDGSVPGIADILFDKDLIPYDQTTTYQQLNTTYVLGPDGKPWATGFKRSTLAGALGFAPLTRSWTSGDTNLSVDSRGNTVDPVMGIDLGMRAMKRVDDSANVPTDKEIGDAIVEAIENLDLKSGFGGYGGYGGGGGSYAQRPYPVNAPDVRWLNLNVRELRLRNPYPNDVYAITTENVTLRRFDIRRERISSERGRLNQWQ